MRVDKKSLFLSVAICLLPILIGVYYYDVLPEQIAVHFNVSGEPDNFVSRTRAIIELPIFFAIVQVIISLVVDFDKTPKKGALIAKGIIPLISVLVQGGIVAYALDNNFNVPQLTVFVIGIVLIILGNYLPKKEFWGKYNFNLFGLEKGVNEQKVVRAYALYMTFSGVAIFISGFFSSTVALVLIVVIAIFSTVLPFYLVNKYKSSN
jgi:putative hemolysis inducing protein